MSPVANRITPTNLHYSSDSNSNSNQSPPTRSKLDEETQTDFPVSFVYKSFLLGILIIWLPFLEIESKFMTTSLIQSQWRIFCLGRLFYGSYFSIRCQIHWHIFSTIYILLSTHSWRCISACPIDKKRLTCWHPVCSISVYYEKAIICAILWSKQWGY